MLEFKKKRNRAELFLFNKRIEEFDEADLDTDVPSSPDNATSYTKFDAKIRRLFPAISEERFSAMRATMITLVRLKAERDKAELVLFNERIGEFSEGDLELDSPNAGYNITSYNNFEEKIRRVFPEISEDRLSAMGAAVTMHLCGF